jgi:hypothetical protein
MADKIEDKQGASIEKGDTVFTKIRGGKREGEVSLRSCHTNLRRLTILRSIK